MKTWWNGLAVREQLIFSMAVLIALVIMLDSLVVEKFRLKAQQLQQQIEQATDDLSWMKQAVQNLPTGKTAKNKVDYGRIVTFINQQITRQGLKKQMQQMTPIQEHSVRVKFSEVGFNQLINFFSAIDGSVVIKEVRILPSDKLGHVNASLVVSSGYSDS